MTTFLNDIILGSANDIQFQTTAGADAGKISQVGDDLVLSNAVGDILLGNGSDDIFIGDGTNTVDIRFEQNMAIFADSSSTRTLTLGGSNTNLVLESPTLNSATFGATTVNNTLTFTTANGFILFDYEPASDTGMYSNTVPLLKIDRGGSPQTILQRDSEMGALTLGIDDTVAICAGDTKSSVRSNMNFVGEQVILAAESGFYAFGFPGNDTTWSNRNLFRFRSDSTTASENGLYIGDGTSTGTQFIDLSRNLVNIGTIASGVITTTELTTAGQGDISTGTSYQQGSVSAIQPVMRSSLLAHSPESNEAVVHPYFFNDLANFVARGGTVTYGGLSADPTSDETARMFEPSARTANASQSEITGSTWTIALTDFPRSLNYGTRIGISFGAPSFSPTSMLIEYSTDNGANYTTALNSSVGNEHYHTYVANGATGINAVRFTLGKRSDSNGPRVMNIYAYNYDSRGMSEYFVDKGGDTLYGNLSVGSNSLTAGSLDINGNADISGTTTVGGTVLGTSAKFGRDADNLIDFTTDNQIDFRVAAGHRLRLTQTALAPITTDAVSLGTSSLNFSDLFLDSGGVINFDNGDVTLTHSSNTLTIAGGQLTIDGELEADSLDIDGTANISDVLTLEGTSDQILILKSTDDGAIYHSYYRGTDRHAYVGFGGSSDTFHIVNEESGGSINFKTASTNALTIGSDQVSTFAGNVTAGSNSLTAGSLDINGNADISGTTTTSGNITATASNATISAAESGGATTKIMGASVGRVGTSSNHNLEILSNNTAAITINTSQNATFAGDITVGDDMFVADGGIINLGTGNDLNLQHDGADGIINNNTGHLYFTNYADDKDIYFRGDDGGSNIITALTLDMSDAGKALFNSGASFGGAISITSDGSNAATLTESASGDFTIHAQDDLRLNANGHDVVLQGASNEFGRLTNSSQNFVIQNTVQDKDIIFKGNDNSATITALTLDMSEAGAATFNSGITATTGTFSGNINANGNIVGDDSTSITNISSIGADTYAADADSTTRFDLTADEMLFLIQDEDIFSSDGTDFLISAKAKIPKRKFTKTNNTDGSADGDIVYFGSTTSMDTGKIYYFTSSGTWVLADADAESTAKGMLGVALGAASDTNGVLIRGLVTLDHDPGTIGDTVFLSTTAGQASSTAPSGNGDIVRVIGYCLDSTNGQIYFNPDGTFVEVTA